jgi:hypothetical protein
VSADVDADVSASLLSDCNLLNLDADIGVDIGLLGHDGWHA